MTAVATPKPAAKPVMASRLDAAIKRLSTKAGEKQAASADGIAFYECPKPKSATGTADRVRKLIASGDLPQLPTGYVVKSRRANVVITATANFHPWDRVAIAERKDAAIAPKPAAKKTAAKKTAADLKPGTGEPEVQKPVKGRRTDGTAAARPRVRSRKR